MNTQHQNIRPGESLENGCTLLGLRDNGDGFGVVLAVERGSLGYATWSINLRTGDTFSGHYFESIAEAAQVYAFRS